MKLSRNYASDSRHSSDLRFLTDKIIQKVDDSDFKEEHLNIYNTSTKHVKRSCTQLPKLNIKIQ